jgi:hypothetical protein
MNVVVRPSGPRCNAIDESRHHARARVFYRKQLLLRRGATETQWHQLFSKHRFDNLRLIDRQRAPGFDLSSFEMACDAAEREAARCRDRAPSKSICPTPEVTVQAILLDIRERGLAVLKEPATRERLARCDSAARGRINRCIAKLHGAVT